MRFCNLKVFLSSLRQGISFHSNVVFKLAHDVFIATYTYSFQFIVPTSAYPLAFLETLAS